MSVWVKAEGPAESALRVDSAGHSHLQSMPIADILNASHSLLGNQSALMSQMPF